LVPMAAVKKRGSVLFICTLLLLEADPVELLPASIDSRARPVCGIKRPLFKDQPNVGPIPILGEVVDTAVGWAHDLGIPLPFNERGPDAGQQKLDCLTPFLMNCTNWHELAARQPCSEACPFVAHLTPFACTFTCVAGDQCHFANKRATFANPLTSLCEDSMVEGCWISKGPGTCVRCRKHFRLEGNGTLCTYGQESTFLWAVSWLSAMKPCLAVLLVLLLAGLVWQLRNSAAGQWELLTTARIHHHLCKIRKSPKVHAGAPLYSLFENVHTQFLIGVGLPLYYNSLVFLLLLSLVFIAVTSLAFVSDDSSVFAYTSKVTDTSICSWAASGLTGTGVYDIYEKFYGFMGRLATSTLVLYVLVFALMLAHAWFQLRHAEWFDQQHSTLKDVALHVEGIPAEATEEAALSRSLGEQLDVEVQAVSIAYDFSGFADEVQALIDRHLAYADAEVRGCGPAGVRISALPHSSAGVEPEMDASASESLENCRSEDAARVRAWFAPGSGEPVRGTGRAFLVFGRRELRDRALRRARDGGRCWVWRDPTTGAEHELRMSLPACEPTNINWGNLGLSKCKRAGLFASRCLVFVGTFCALALLVFWPYAAFVTSYLREAGIMPRGLVMGTLGTLVGFSGAVMCMVIGSQVGQMGLQTVEDEMVVVFVTFTHFCVGMSAFNVYLTWFYTQNMWEDPGASWNEHFQGRYIEGPVLTLRDLMQEIDFGYRVVQLLVPGVLFTPCLVCPLQNFLVPYLHGSLLLLLGRKKSGREAERYLEPLPIGLPWDYQGHVTLPACCCLTLFIQSPAMRWSFGCLCAWCLFFYAFQRVMHLRVCKKMLITSSKLDCVVLYLGWGLLLAELAACHAYWKARRSEWPWLSIPIAVAASYVLYWASLRWAVGVRLSEQEPPAAAAPAASAETAPASPGSDGELACAGQAKAAEVCYDWLNVNPVYVLKSQYCRDLLGGAEPAVFYDAGKEYLQLTSEGAAGPAQVQRKRPSTRHWATFDWGPSVELEGLGCTGPLLCEGETPRSQRLLTSGSSTGGLDSERGL